MLAYSSKVCFTLLKQKWPKLANHLPQPITQLYQSRQIQRLQPNRPTTPCLLLIRQTQLEMGLTLCWLELEDCQRARQVANSDRQGKRHLSINKARMPPQIMLNNSNSSSLLISIKLQRLCSIQMPLQRRPSVWTKTVLFQRRTPLPLLSNKANLSDWMLTDLPIWTKMKEVICSNRHKTTMFQVIVIWLIHICILMIAEMIAIRAGSKIRETQPRLILRRLCTPRHTFHQTNLLLVFSSSKRRISLSKVAKISTTPV